MNETMEKFVTSFIEMTSNKDIAALDECIADTVTMHTPRFFKPITNKEHVKAALRGFMSLVEGLNYADQRHWVNGNDVIFEFRGKLGDIELHGVDIFTINDEGKISELSVMIRPESALQAIGKTEDKLVMQLLAQKQAQQG